MSPILKAHKERAENKSITAATWVNRVREAGTANV